MRAATKKSWSKVDSTEDLSFEVTKLTEGTPYVFRVAAQNAVGIGEWAELKESVTPKCQHGTI